ncbi:MAG: glutamine-hydrolyzing GMP synthase [bacterium]|nr:glutamine-hydrolyzing GMP synthase [bacterium]
MIRTLGKVTPEVLAQIQEEMTIRKTREVFLLFALGSQFDHLIKQQLEKLGVFCLVADPATCRTQDVQHIKPVGIILSGGPVSVYSDPPPFDGDIFGLEIPVFGICLGFQLWARWAVGCEVYNAEKREFGRHELTIFAEGVPLFEGCDILSTVLQSHGDAVQRNSGLEVFAKTENTPVAAGKYKHLWGVQFHPEVSDTTFGQQMFENFCFRICEAKDKYPAQAVAHQKRGELTDVIRDKQVLLALSGGSDSSVVAHLLKPLVCLGMPLLKGVYIKGIDRPEDEKHVVEFFGNRSWIDLKIVDATELFLQALAGIEHGHHKRVAMRSIYKGILEAEAKDCGASFIAQGTLYTDISESGGGHATGAKKAQIKLHHNVDLGFSLPELLPLADQVKDTARDIGRFMNVPEALLTRHPFPGPGLVVRIEGEVTREKLRIARALDGIFMEELHRADLYQKVWQAGVTVLNSRATCTKGDDASMGWVVCPWAFWSVNGFTAQAVEIPWDFMKRVSRRMTNEVREVGRVVFNATDKPPATIEWE